MLGFALAMTRDDVACLRSTRLRIRLLALVGVCLSVAVFAPTGGPIAIASPGADAARTCSPPTYPGLGYFTSLSVSGVSCATGRKVALAYYHCRTRHGAAGRCYSTVLGFSCSEKRNSIPTEIEARVTCRHQHQTVTHTYQQDI
jgi:hypothetical protein